MGEGTWVGRLKRAIHHLLEVLQQPVVAAQVRAGGVLVEQAQGELVGWFVAGQQQQVALAGGAEGEVDPGEGGADALVVGVVEVAGEHPTINPQHGLGRGDPQDLELGLLERLRHVAALGQQAHALFLHQPHGLLGGAPQAAAVVEQRREPVFDPCQVGLGEVGDRGQPQVQRRQPDRPHRVVGDRDLVVERAVP